MYLWWDSEIQTFLRKDCLRGEQKWVEMCLFQLLQYF